MSRQNRRRHRLLLVRRLSAHFHDRASQVPSARGNCHQMPDPGRCSGPVRMQEQGVLEYLMYRILPEVLRLGFPATPSATGRSNLQPWL